MTASMIPVGQQMAELDNQPSRSTSPMTNGAALNDKPAHSRVAGCSGSGAALTVKPSEQSRKDSVLSTPVQALSDGEEIPNDTGSPAKRPKLEVQKPDRDIAPVYAPEYSSGANWQGKTNASCSALRAHGNSQPHSHVVPTTISSSSTFKSVSSDYDILSREAQLLFDYAQRLHLQTCSRCTAPLSMDIKEMAQNAASDFMSKQYMTSVLTCRFCKAATCVACGQAPDAIQTATAKEDSKAYTLGWHCASGRDFILWMLVCIPEISQSCKAKNVIRQPSRRWRAGRRSFDKDLLPGIGYRRDSSSLSDELISPGPTQNPELDAELLAVFSSLTLALSSDVSGAREQEYDHEAFTLATLRHSRFMECVSELLHNHSIDDIVNRAAVYDALISFLDLLSASSGLPSLLYEQRLSSGLYRDLMDTSEPQQKDQRISHTHRLSSLFDLLTELRSQTSDFAARAQRKASDVANEIVDDDELAEAVRICDRLAASCERLSHNHVMPYSGPSSGKGKAKAVDDVSNHVLDQWFRDNCVAEVADDVMMHNHDYAKAAAEVSTSPPGRIKKILMELTTLRSALPKGIFVKHGESRIDLFKVLIVGPQGTPYENGLFEFDFFCPENYPVGPPQVTFKTTGGGRAHFNPNLYNCGKVCLSLLGTWAGEPWRPNQSTLLQVLVSIQSMVFCDEPWTNEPGREHFRGSSNSLRYQHKIRDLTIRYALTPWAELLKSKESLDPNIWQNVARKHFEDNADRILYTSARWHKDRLSCKLPSKSHKAALPTFGVHVPPLGAPLSSSQVMPNNKPTSKAKKKAKKENAAMAQHKALMAPYALKPSDFNQPVGTGSSTTPGWPFTAGSPASTWPHGPYGPYGPYAANSMYAPNPYKQNMAWPSGNVNVSMPLQPSFQGMFGPHAMLAPGTNITPGSTISYNGKTWQIGQDGHSLLNSDLSPSSSPGVKMKAADKTQKDKSKTSSAVKPAAGASSDEFVKAPTSAKKSQDVQVPVNDNPVTCCSDLVLEDLPFHPGYLPDFAQQKLAHLTFDDWRQDKVKPRLSMPTLMLHLSLSWQFKQAMSTIYTLEPVPPAMPPPEEMDSDMSDSYDGAADDPTMSVHHDSQCDAVSTQNSTETCLTALQQSLSEMPQGRVSNEQLAADYAAHVFPDIETVVAKEQSAATSKLGGNQPPFPPFPSSSQW